MKTVLILCGGKSEEHEISLISAKCVLDAIDRNRFHPLVVGVSKKGIWHLQDEKTFYLGEFRADRIRLNEQAPRVKVMPYPDEAGRAVLEADGKEVHFDVVFPIIHGKFGEDGTLQGFLEILGVPYVGAGCGSSWICMDKALTKVLCEKAGIRVTEYVLLMSPDELGTKREEIAKLGFPIFVKPAREGSSVGVAKVTAESGLPAAVDQAFRYGSKVLLERGIPGREIECAVLGLNDSPEASLPGEIIVSKEIGWYSYEAKYLLPEAARTVAPALLDVQEIATIREFCKRVFHVLECDGMARVDVFLEEGTNHVYLNEANTLPGFTPISMYPKMWQSSGIAYPELITRLIDLAFARR